MSSDDKITKYEDIIDSRDVTERIEKLRELIVEYKNEKYDTKEEEEELALLEKLEEDGKFNFGDEWEFGVTLIRYSYFEDYAREFAEDIGAIKDDLQWPATCIDWEQAAGELQYDYTEITFDDIEYWGR